MSLKSEIETLRAQIDAYVHKVPTAETSAVANHDPRAPVSNTSQDRYGIETLLATVKETLNEYENELNRFPHLTALTALTIGLVTGVLIGRRIR